MPYCLALGDAELEGSIAIPEAHSNVIGATSRLGISESVVLRPGLAAPRHSSFRPNVRSTRLTPGPLSRTSESLTCPWLLAGPSVSACFVAAGSQAKSSSHRYVAHTLAPPFLQGHVDKV